MQIEVMKKSFGVNAILVVVKIVVGIFTRSSALVADGMHSLSDLLTDIMALFGITQANKPPDKEHPFGHGKIEYVVSLLLGVGILFVAYQLIESVIANINEPIIVPGILSLVVAIIVIIVKLMLSRYLLANGAKLSSQIITASGKESLTDVFSSIVVVVGVSAVLIGEAFNVTILMYGDRIASVLIAMLIVRIALSIMIEATQSLLGKSANQKILDTTREIASQVEGVIRVDHLDMIVYGHYYQVLIDIRVDGKKTVREGHDIAHLVKMALQKRNPKLTHVIVHVNPEE